MGRPKLKGKSSKKRKHVSDSDSDWMDEYKSNYAPKTRSSKKRKNWSRDHAGVARHSSRKLTKSKSQAKDASTKHTIGGSKDCCRKCHWVQCTKNARPNSKYCSDQCGETLATLLLKHILPEKIQSRNESPCIAEKLNNENLLLIRKRKTDIQQRLDSLEKRRKELDQFIESVSQLKCQQGAPKKQHFDKEGLAYCVLCAHEITTKNYLKHVERCYNKIESQMSFVSKNPSKIFSNEGNPICDFFSPETGMFCKRLKVLCPERAHHKAETIRTGSGLICGAPVAENPHELNINKVCTVSKSECNQHRFWEKYRRAEIDVQKVSAWVELEMVCGKEKNCLTAIEDRGGGVLGFLLHHTIHHHLSESEEGRILNGAE